MRLNTRFYKTFGIDPNKYKNIEIQETLWVYKPFKCLDHDGEDFKKCIPCLQQKRGLRKSKKIFITSEHISTIN